MVSTGETVGLAEWIIDDTSPVLWFTKFARLLFLFFLPSFWGIIIEYCFLKNAKCMQTNFFEYKES